MKAINKRSKITIYWKIWRGVNKVTENFSNLSTNLKVFLMGHDDVIVLNPSVNKGVDPGYEVLEMTISAGTLGVGAYSIKAVWTKNDGRDLLTSMRSGVFGITDSDAEASVNDEEIRLVSSVESYGRDGMSAFETAVMRNLNNGISSEVEWVGNEAKRIADEEARDVAEKARDEAETAREGAEAKRVDTFDANEETRQTTFETNEANRGTTFTSNETGREEAYLLSEQDREVRFAAAEENRNKGEAIRQAAFEGGENNRASTFTRNEESRQRRFEDEVEQRAEDFAAYESSRQRAFEQAEEDRGLLFRSKEDAREADELKRDQAETIRNAQESVRQQAEQIRIDTFDENERGRIATFNANEAARIAAENERKQNEAERETNEAIRQESYQDKLPVSAVVQETGDGENVVMSQKAVRDFAIEGLSNSADIEFESQYQQKKLDFTIPKGSTIYITGDLPQINGRTESSDSDYQILTNGVVADRDINYVKSVHITGMSHITYEIQGLGRLNGFSVLAEKNIINNTISTNKNTQDIESINESILLNKQYKEDTFDVGFYAIRDYNIGDNVSDIAVSSQSDYVRKRIFVKKGDVVKSYGINGLSVKTWMFTDTKLNIVQIQETIVSSAYVNNTLTAPCDGYYYFNSYSLKNEHFLIIESSISNLFRRDMEIDGSIKELKDKVEHLEKNPTIKYYLAQGLRVEIASLVSGEKMSLSDFPNHNKFGDNISFRADITAFSSIMLGRKVEKSGAYYKWVKIDTSNILVYSGSDLSAPIETIPHTLTFESFIYISLHINDTGNCVLNVTTKNGHLNTILNKWDINVTGVWEVVSDSSLNNCILTAINNSLKSDIWIIGASYESLNSSMGWGNYIEELGVDYTSMLWNGYPGRGSEEAYDDLIRCSSLCIPKLIYWTMWGNGTADSLDVYIGRVLEFCENNNITLVIIDRPNSTNASNYDERKAVIQKYINQGVRYVNSCLALSADRDNGDGWYEGYLAEDGKHPTALGARALAHQVVLDIPEFGNYKKG